MKNSVLKIVVTIVLVAIGLSIFLIMNNKTEEEGLIYFTLVDQNDNTIYDDKISFNKGDTLIEILDEKYDIRYEEDMYGYVLYDIGPIKTDFKNDYLAIYINGEYSSVGISSIILTKDMKIVIKEVLL